MCSLTNIKPTDGNIERALGFTVKRYCSVTIRYCFSLRTSTHSIVLNEFHGHRHEVKVRHRLIRIFLENSSPSPVVSRANPGSSVLLYIQNNGQTDGLGHGNRNLHYHEGRSRADSTECNPLSRRMFPTQPDFVGGKNSNVPQSHYLPNHRASIYKHGKFWKSHDLF
jgi:hypothetical protein